LQKYIGQEKEVELVQPRGEFGRMVHDEFLEQVPLYPEAPEVSSEQPFGEQMPDEDI
jgi:hypothetical protein